MKKLVWLLMVVSLFIGVANANSVWNPAANGIYPPATGDWGVAANWTRGVPVVSGDGTVGNDPKGVWNVSNAAECVVADTQSLLDYVQGDGGPGGVVRIVNGGILTTAGGWMSVGYNYPATLIVEPGGVFNCGGHMWNGMQNTGVGTIEINGGTINVSGNFGLGWYNGTQNGVAYFYINDGSLNLDHWDDTESIHDGSFIDIELGTMTIPGNKISAVAAYVTAGKITAYGGTGTVHYDTTTNSGKTTIWAVLATELPTKASDPIPAHSATDVSINPTLSWIPGAHTSSHDVYFGTDPTPDAGEFQGNQTIGTFNPGSLELDTVYYWRIDEKNTLGTTTGDVWSFTATADSTYSLIGKVMCGYQGWFNAPGDGTPYNFRHWGQNGNFTPTDCSVDFWPDMTEYTAGEKYLVSSFYDGKDRYVFSSHNYNTVVRHFQWMYDYGIDGVYVQRFTSEITPGSTMFNERNTVLSYCKAGANIYGRKYAVMYDLSGTGSSAEIEEIKDDWKYLVDTVQVGKDPADDAYMTHGGEPVVALWGYGFKRVYEEQESRDLIEWFKNDPVYGGNIVMLGVEPNWVTNKNNKTDYPWLEDTLLLADIISPWRVGRPKNTGDVTNWASGRGSDDQDWCDTNNKEYLPVIFPGFSWYNMHYDTPDPTPLNQIPRNGGQFLWDQVNACINTIGANMMYVAMFDEVDEGTAIFKVTNDPPEVLPSVFLTPDYDGYDLPSDEYLWLVGQAARGLRGEISVNPTRPERTGCAGPADFNCDGYVDVDDVSYMAIVWLTADPTADIALPADGIVNLVDFSVLAQEWSGDAVAYWRLDETTGALAADDSANGYDATLMNMDDSDWVTGKKGNALDFDGVNDTVEIAYDAGLNPNTKDWSVSFWLKSDSASQSTMVVSKRSDAFPFSQYSIGLSAGDSYSWPAGSKITFLFREAVGIEKGGYATADVDISDWTHVAIVLNRMANTVYVYINGVSVPVTLDHDGGLPTITNSASLYIGGHPSVLDLYQGQIDEVRIYDRALSVTKIAEIAQ